MKNPQKAPKSTHEFAGWPDVIKFPFPWLFQMFTTWWRQYTELQTGLSVHLIDSQSSEIIVLDNIYPIYLPYKIYMKSLRRHANSVTITIAITHHRQNTFSFFLTFPWPMSSSRTFPGFPRWWPPWVVGEVESFENQFGGSRTEGKHVREKVGEA